MSPPFSNVNLLRIILENESIFDKPGSEEFFSQLRENWEVSMLLTFYTGDSGTATENPTETVLTDGNAAHDADEHNFRSLVIIDGLAAGNIYEIDDTAATTLTCTGDTLLADGVRSGDAYKIFYNLKHLTAHTHDGVDTPSVALADGEILVKKLVDYTTGSYIDAEGKGLIITGTGYLKKLEFLSPRAGTIKTRVGIISDGVNLTYAKVYINGVAQGTERSTTSATWQYWEEDIAINAGDLVQLYCKRAGGSTFAYLAICCGNPTVPGPHKDYYSQPWI